MNKFLFALLVLSPAAAFASPSHCDNEAITDISSSGRLIQLNSGLNFLVYPGEQTISVFWEPQDKVTLCAKGGAAYEITKSGTNGGKVDVLRQF